jgi:hypothetical protein
MVADLVQCIRLDMDCADVCLTSGLIATRRSGGDVSIHRGAAARLPTRLPKMRDGMRQHAERHEHCRICAETCQDCEASLRGRLASLADTLPPAH